MSNRPDKCRWCGCAEIIRDGFPTNGGGREVLFACRSVWYETALGWVRDPEQCGGQAGMLYKRIAVAVAAIEASVTYRLEKDDYGAWLKGASDGIWMDRLEVENVKKILQGNNPEIPEGSANSESEQ